MSAYRDDQEALRQRIRTLEESLRQTERELAARTADLSDRDAKLETLRSVIGAAHAPAITRGRRRRGVVAAMMALGAVAVALPVLVLRAGSPPVAPAAAVVSEPRVVESQPAVTLAVVVDTRPSMGPHLHRVASAVTTLAAVMGDDDRIGVLQVDNHGSKLVVPLSPVASARPTLAASLAGLRAAEDRQWERGTVSSAIHAGVELLQRTQGEARILVVTDGRDVGWDLAESAAARAAQQNLRVSAIAVGDVVEGYPQSIARAGHGVFVDLRNEGALAASLRPLLGRQ